MVESDAVLSVRGLSFVRPGPARADAPFTLAVERLDLARGEKVAVVGPSGSGKTTLLELLAGILLPAAGRVAFGGVEWAGLAEAERRRRRAGGIGFVFQEFELLEHLTVLENILLPYLVSDSLALDAAARRGAEELGRQAGLGALLRRKPRALSQGERQRAAVCRALVTRPALLLADEPTGSLDRRTGAAVFDLFVAAVGERDAALVVATHDTSLLAAFDRVVDLGDGKA